MADFAKQPRGPLAFDSWLCKTQLQTPLGPFDIELREPPDGESVGALNELGPALLSRSHELLSQILASYQLAAENKYWMKDCGVPRNLERDQLIQYLRDRTITIARNRERRLEVTVDITPKWDIEHGIHWTFESQRLVRQPS